MRRYASVFALFLAACSGLNPPEYVKWVESYDHGLHLSRVVEPYVFSLQYKPAAYSLFQQEGIHVSASKLAPGTLNDDMQYYTLTLGLANGEGDFLDYQVTNVAQQQQKLYYFSYRFQDHIYLVENGRKLPCRLFHFERSYDLKPTRTFVLGFDNPSRSTAPSDLVIDSPWLETGPVQFHVEKKNIPTVNP